MVRVKGWVWSSWLCGCMTLAICVLGVPSLAQAQTDDEVDAAREQFRLGNEAYQDGDYQRAVEHFTEANRIVPNARLLLYIGQSYVLLDQPNRALEFVRQYAATSTEAADEVRDILRGLEDTFAGAFRQAQRGIDSAYRLAAGLPPETDNTMMFSAGDVVPIQVRSTPSGATVYIDDQALGAVGQTPLDTELFTGPHHVIVALPHHRVYRERVNAVRDSSSPILVINAVLERMDANVDISVNPVTARVVYIGQDGTVQELGQGGWQGHLPAGQCLFLLQQSGRERRIEYELEGGDAVETVTLNLDPRDDITEAPEELGHLTLRSNLAFATITVDGVEAGSGIGDFEVQLTPGPHTVRVTQDGYETVVDNVRIASGERQTWTAPSRLEELGGTPVAAIVTGSLGGVALAMGIIFGLSASDSADQFNQCQTELNCEEGAGLRDDAQSAALIADISLVAALGLVTTSVVLFLTQGPSHAASSASLDEEPDQRWSVVPSASDDGFSLTFGWDL